MRNKPSLLPSSLLAAGFALMLLGVVLAPSTVSRAWADDPGTEANGCSGDAICNTGLCKTRETCDGQKGVLSGCLPTSVPPGSDCTGCGCVKSLDQTYKWCVCFIVP